MTATAAVSTASQLRGKTSYWRWRGFIPAAFHAISRTRRGAAATLWLLAPAYTRRMSIGPGRFDQDASGSTVAGLGVTAAVDLFPSRAF